MAWSRELVSDHLRRQLERSASLGTRAGLQFLEEWVSTLRQLLDQMGFAIVTSNLGEVANTLERLATSYQVRLAELRAVHKQSVRLTKSTSWEELNTALAETLSDLVGEQTELTAYASSDLVRGGSSGRFTALDAPGTDVTLEELEQHGDVLKLKSPDDDSVVAVLKLKQPMEPVNRHHIEPMLDALVPSIISTAEIILLIADVQRRAHLEAELSTARIVQSTLMPPPESYVTEAMEVSAFVSTATECGGDWWNHYVFPEGRHLLVLGDVSGHGTGSAIVTAVVKGHCDALMERGVVPLDDLLERLDKVVARVGGAVSRNMSFAAILFDRNRKRVQLAFAGHPPVYVMAPSSSGRTFTAVHDRTPMLGQIQRPPGQPFRVIERPYTPGEAWFASSDGLTESASSTGELFGERRLIRLLRRLESDRGADALLSEVMTEHRTFVGDNQPDDDITVVVACPK